MKQAQDLSCDAIVALVQSIQDSLFLDQDPQGRPVWNPEKSWSADELETIGEALAKHGLAPTSIEPAEQPAARKRHVLYGFAADKLAGNEVFDDPSLAADHSTAHNNVLVVPVILPLRKTVLVADQPVPCECQEPGTFCSGVPGIIAEVENCRLVLGGKVERCDACQRYASDQAAHDKLVELGMA